MTRYYTLRPCLLQEPDQINALGRIDLEASLEATKSAIVSAWDEVN